MSEPAFQTHTIIGTPVAITDYTQAVSIASQRASKKTAVYCVAAANTHMVALARHDELFGKALEKFDQILPDGMPLVWCINTSSSYHLADRVYGPTFMLRCLEATQTNFSHFFLGGSESLLSNLQEKLKEKFPNISVAGTYSPPFGKWPIDEDQKIIQILKNANADFIWVGLGCPKQELWLAKYKEQLPAGVYGAVGAAFAFHAGQVKQAPAWMQKRGLEWAFRLFAEPRRLWKRYFTYNLLFLFYLVKDSLFRERR